MKRLVVGVFVSALTVVGLAPAASAASTSDAVVVKVKVAKAVKPKPGKIIDWDAPGKAIDWDAPAPVSGGGASTQRIDWD